MPCVSLCLLKGDCARLVCEAQRDKGLYWRCWRIKVRAGKRGRAGSRRAHLGRQLPKHQERLHAEKTFIEQIPLHTTQSSAHIAPETVKADAKTSCDTEHEVRRPAIFGLRFCTRCVKQPQEHLEKQPHESVIELVKITIPASRRPPLRLRRQCCPSASN